MLCNTLSVNGWQNVRNFNVRFNALRYLYLKILSIFSLLRVNGNRFNSVTLMLSMLSNSLNTEWKDLNTLRKGGSQFLYPTSRVVSLRQ